MEAADMTPLTELDSTPVEMSTFLVLRVLRIFPCATPSRVRIPRRHVSSEHNRLLSLNSRRQEHLSCTQLTSAAQPAAKQHFPRWQLVRMEKPTSRDGRTRPI